MAKDEGHGHTGSEGGGEEKRRSALQGRLRLENGFISRRRRQLRLILRQFPSSVRGCLGGVRAR